MFITCVCVCVCAVSIVCLSCVCMCVSVVSIVCLQCHASSTVALCSIRVYYIRVCSSWRTHSHPNVKNFVAFNMFVTNIRDE